MASMSLYPSLRRVSRSRSKVIALPLFTNQTAEHAEDTEKHEKITTKWHQKAQRGFTPTVGLRTVFSGPFVPRPRPRPFAFLLARSFCAVRILSLLLPLRAKQRKQNHVAYRSRVGEQHGEAVDPHALAGRRRQPVGKRTDVVLVHDVRLFIAAFPLAKLLLEAAALLFRIVQLAEAIGDFQTADKNLESLYPFGFIGFVLGERRDCHRKVVDDRRLN